MVEGGFDWELLLRLTRDIPNDLDKSKHKEEIPQEIATKIKERDKVCKLCGSSKDLVIHHVIPNKFRESKRFSPDS